MLLKRLASSSCLGTIRSLRRRWIVAAAMALHACLASPVVAQTVATITLTPGWATFGQALPQGAAPSGLRVGTFATQTDVKNRWPDGSIRFAVVSVFVPTGGAYPLVAAPISTGTFAPNIPTASVALTIGPVVYTATLPTAASADRWLSGPLAYEGRSVIAPLSAATGLPHPFLRVNFDTRVYSDGGARVDVSVENVLDQLGAATVTYDAAVTVNGAQVFTKAGVQHYYLTRWRKVFALATTTLASITPDITPFNTSKALPPYLPMVANVVNTAAGAEFDILGNGAVVTNMPDHGGRPDLAPFPDWTARYLVHRNLTQRAFVLANGDLSGSWPVHMRESGALSGVGPERLVSIDQRPNLWLDERAQAGLWDYVKGTPLPIREYGSLVPGPGQTALIPDNAHQPSIAYVPYLLTGDRYYSEEMAFWANYSMARTYPGDGLRSSQGIIENNEVRGIGWPLRNMVDAAAYYPDSSPVKAYLSQKVINNLQWLDSYATSQINPATNPFSILWINRRPDGGQYISLWEQSYLAYAIDRANQQGFVGGLTNRDAIAQFHLKLFTSEPEYPKAQAGAYLIAVGPANATNPAVLGSFYPSMAQIWTATQGQERPFAGFYGPEARMDLMIGVQNGWVGAQTAYNYLFPFIGVATQPCLGLDLADLACRAGWALDLPATGALASGPAQITSPIPGSTLASGTQIFQWNSGVGVSSYQLLVGSSQGGNDIYSGPIGENLSASVTVLPTSGGTIWVRLSSNIAGAWQSVDYSYAAANDLPFVNGFGVRSTVSVDGNGIITAPSFNTAAGDVLVAFVSSSGPSTGGETMTVSGGSLPWTLVTRANGQFGVSEIWTATTTTARSGIAVTSTPTLATPDQSLVVVDFANSSGTGAFTAASGASGAPSVSVTPTRAGSFVFGVGNDWNGAVTRTLGNLQTMVHEFLNVGNGDTFWVQRADNPVSTVGVPVQINDTAPTNHVWNLAAVEIMPVPKTIPTITWPTPAPIVYGTLLGAAQLNATASVPGTFVYNPAAGTLLSGGTSQTLSVTFTPTDTVTYATTSASVSLSVTATTPSISWTPPAPIVFGTALSGTQLNATAGVAGSFAPYTYSLGGTQTPAAGVVLGAGTWTLSVRFTPTDTSFSPVTATVALTVLKATPVITWPTPGNIVSGTALGPAQLNATASLTGTNFVYSTAAGPVVSGVTVLPVGPAQRLQVVFTPTATDTANFTTATKVVAITVAAPASGSTPSPRTIGAGIAGTFNDATGHSGQSHLVFAPNANVWWLFTLSSAHDAVNNHTVQAYVSSGPDLATATWSAPLTNPSSPDLGNVGGATNSLFAGGRSLGVALRTVGTTDYVHLFASAAFDGQVSSNGHMRAQLGTTSITWGAWDNPGSPTSASEWQGPASSGSAPSAAATHPSWGNSVGISTGGFIHHFSVTMDQEVDCTVGRSANADIASTWTNGFGTNHDPSLTTQTSPPNTTAVIDKTMTFECKAMAFAPLASDVMLAVYSNGAVAQPNLTNLRFTRSGANGTWTNVPANNTGGTGTVFTGNVNINQNDWALVPVTASTIYAFRRSNTTGTGAAVAGATYSVAGNSWAALSTAPPAFGAGQAMKIGGSNPPVSGGLFGATDGGTNVWLFVINTDAANSILYTKFNGSTWTNWATVPGTDVGTHTRNFIAGYPKAASNQIGLAWTEGSGTFNVVTTSLNTAAGVAPSTATLTAPANGATVSGSAVTVTGTAAPGSGTIAGVQFILDGATLGAEDLSSPYSIAWDTTTASNGTHFLSAIARDTNGGTGAASTVTVTVNNDVTAPTVTMTAPANGATVSGISVAVSANAADDIGVVGVQFLLDGAPLGTEATTSPYAIVWNATGVPGGTHTLSARARDAFGRQTTSAAVSVTIPKITTTVNWPTPAPIVYGTLLSATQLNATASAPGVPSVPGTFVYAPAIGAKLLAGTRTLNTTFAPTDSTTYDPAAGSVSIVITDTTPPTVIVPLNATLEATSPLGAQYIFSASASDPVDGPLPVTCTPTSGSIFPLGTRNVQCTAVDLNGNSRTASFLVTVQDTTPPIVTPPAAISVPATEMGGVRANVTGSAGSAQLAAFLVGGTAADLGDAAPTRLTSQIIVSGAPTDTTVATLFPMGSTTVVYRFRDAFGNIGTAVSSVTVTARIVDAPTMVQATTVGGQRLASLQKPDGGWQFMVGSMTCGGTYGTCSNTIGTTGLGLLAAYVRSNDLTMLTKASAAGDLLVSRYNIAKAQNPKTLPVNRDIEFLVALANLTGNQTYATTATAWFQIAVDRFPNAADQVDDTFTRRGSQGLRTVAAWDAASYIRAAKAVGLADRALAAANRVVAREADWKDTNPAHRYDKCGSSSGCGPAGNAFAYDYTIVAEGSLLWGIHDLPGFDAKVAEYRSFLIAQQDPDGAWDVGDSQITSFVVMGLAAVGGTGANTAIAKAAGFFLANQLPQGGWPADVTAAGVSAEFGEVDGEVVRAIATLFSTPTGADVSVVPSQLSTVTFSNVSVPGMTTVVAVDRATVPAITGGFEVVNDSLTYQVATTATISGPITVCFNVPWINDPAVFASLRILHGEHAVPGDAGTLVDRTILTGPNAPDFLTRRVCALTTSLSPFAVAFALPDTTSPVVTVPAAVTLEALDALGASYNFTASATDDVEGAVVTTCLPASSQFPIGVTTVQCTARDAAGNSGSASFTVTVVDTTPPAVTVPAAATLEATGPLGAAFSYSASASDLVDGGIAANCLPANGTFALGTTTVQCSATDAHSNTGSASFTVTVRDTTPPAVTVPANVTIQATGSSGAAYSFSASALDTVDGTLSPSCDPASGAMFPVGSTTVTCTATDAASNAGSASFVVTVTPKVVVNVAPVAYDGQFTTSVKDAFAGALRATDLNDDRLTFEIVTKPSEGKVSVNAATGAFTYEPHGDEKKTDRFTFRVSDGKRWSNTATVTIERVKDKEKDREKEKEREKDR